MVGEQRPPARAGHVTLGARRYSVELFIDFGLFELLAASGLVAIARAIDARPIARGITLAMSVAAPFALLWMVPGEGARWLAALAFGTSLVNASIIVTTRNRTSVNPPSTRPGA